MVLSLQIILLDLRPSVRSIYCPDDSSSSSRSEPSPSFLFNEPTSLSLRVLLLASTLRALFLVTKRALGPHVAPSALRVAGTRASVRFDVLGPIAILARLACLLPELHIAIAHKPLLKLPQATDDNEYYDTNSHTRYSPSTKPHSSTSST